MISNYERTCERCREKIQNILDEMKAALENAKSSETDAGNKGQISWKKGQKSHDEKQMEA